MSDDTSPITPAKSPWAPPRPSGPPAIRATPRAIDTRLAGVGSDLSGVTKHPDAIEVLELNTQLFPRSSDAHASLAAAFAAAGDTGPASQHYEKALAIDPKIETARTALAKLRRSKSP